MISAIYFWTPSLRLARTYYNNLNSIFLLIFFVIKKLELEDFEGKVDQIKEGGDVDNIDESPSWIHDIFNRYSEYFTLNDTNVEVEDLEPPMLDETWGLHGSDRVKNSHLIDTVFQDKLNGKLLIIDLVILFVCMNYTKHVSRKI